jgi:hypothetical protein
MDYPWDQSFATSYFLFWTNHLKRFGESSSKNNCSNEMGTRLHLGSKIAEIEQMTRGRTRNFPSQRSIPVTTLPLGEIKDKAVIRFVTVPANIFLGTIFCHASYGCSVL